MKRPDPKAAALSVARGVGASLAKPSKRAAGGPVQSANPEHLEMLAKAASDQRGGPEAAMTQAQRAIGGGVLSFCLEHVGDIYNRMHNTGYGGLDQYGPTDERRYVVLDKVAKTLRTLNQKYGFEREHEENLRENENYRAENEGISPDAYRAGVDAALKKYAEEHSKLPVYNRPQELARTASIALGEQDFRKAASSLSELKRMAEDHDLWHQEINKVDPASVSKASGGPVEGTLLDSTGKPVHHTPEGVENFRKQFKGTQAVDGKGRPLRMYHGSPEPDLTEISQTRTAHGHFFTPDPDTAAYYTGKDDEGKVYESYLNIKNLADFDDPVVFDKVAREAIDYNEERDSDAVQSFVARLYKEGYGKHPEVTKFFDAQSGIEDVGEHYPIENLLSDNYIDADEIDSLVAKLPDNVKRAYDEAAPVRSKELEDAEQAYGSQDFYMHYQNDFMRAAQSLGYDGVVLTDPSSTGESVSYVVFDPGQIKSATDNDGTWDHPNDMTKASGGSVEDTLLDSTGKPVHHTPEGVEAFKKWHEGSKVVDEQGRPLQVYHGSIRHADTDTVKGMGDIHEFDRLFSTKFRRPSVDTMGSWFSTNPGERGAEMYSGSGAGSVIYPVYLSIKNPHETTFRMMERRARLLANGEDDGRKLGEPEVNAYRQWLSDMGKDGVKIVHDEGREDKSTEFKHQDAWIALEPGQIKSAVGNDGTWDHPTDITKAGGGEVDEHGIAAPQPFDIDAAKEQYLTDTAGINRRPLEGHDPRLLFHTSKEEQSDDGGYGPEDPGESTEQYGAFDPDRSELGIHVGSRDQAEGRINRYAIETGSAPRTLPVYVAIKNPIRLEDYGTFDWHAVLPQLERQNVMSFQEAESFLKDMHQVMEEHGALSDETDKVGNAYMREFLLDKGYDSAVYLNRFEGVLERPPAPGKSTSISPPHEHTRPEFTDEMFKRQYPGAHDSYILFKPPQAKSMFATEYNPDKGDLSKAAGGEVGSGLEGMELHALNPGHAEEYIRAYHGTPHSFDAFDASKIGSGEGAQAYGYGIYVAESPDVAKTYAMNLSNRDMANQGRLNAHANAKRSVALAGDPRYVADDIKFVLRNEPDHPQKELLQDTLWFLESGEYEKPLENSGNLYKVDLPKDMAESMADWDKPLSEQPAKVQEVLRYTDLTGTAGYIARTPEKTTFGDLHDALKNQISPRQIAEYFRSAGIPGISYFDAGSRGSRSGTRNFVVFPGEERRLKIRKAGGGSAGSNVKPFKRKIPVADVKAALRVARKARGLQ